MSDDDHILLRRYVDEKSEEAFAALVRRHLDLVYSVALRQVGGDVHLAQDVAQTVFTALARKAASLTTRPVLGGWLYRTAQFTAIDVVRMESRRRARESEAQTMNEFSLNPNSGAEVDWEKLRPTLDQAIGELDDDDRDAVVLRFFEGKTFGEVGAKLSLSENTARMRVERALDKLHALLARRGVTSTSAALAGALANQTAMAAPAGLAATVTGAALAGATTGAGAAGVGIFAFMSTGKIILGLAGAALVAGFGAAFVAANTVRDVEAKLATTSSQQAALNAKLGDLENRVSAETQRGQRAEQENARLLLEAKQLQAADETEKAAAEPITDALIDERIKRARELVNNGNPETALKELLWFYRNESSSSFAFRMTRMLMVPELLIKLGERYPEALTALRARQEKAKLEMMADGKDHEAASEFASINRNLNENNATVAMLDQLPAGDERRAILAGDAQDALIASRRYADALEGRPYRSVSSTFEMMIQERPLPADTPNPVEAREKNRAEIIMMTVKNIEVLAGAGDVAHARSMAERLLAYDGTESTRALIQQHALRAGHPEVLTSPGH